MSEIKRPRIQIQTVTFFEQCKLLLNFVTIFAGAFSLSFLFMLAVASRDEIRWLIKNIFTPAVVLFFALLVGTFILVFIQRSLNTWESKNDKQSL